jgi:hypothetical protein
VSDRLPLAGAGLQKDELALLFFFVRFERASSYVIARRARGEVFHTATNLVVRLSAIADENARCIQIRRDSIRARN